MRGQCDRRRWLVVAGFLHLGIGIALYWMSPHRNRPLACCRAMSVSAFKLTCTLPSYSALRRLPLLLLLLLFTLYSSDLVLLLFALDNGT